MNNFEIHASLYINTNINILTSVQYPLQSNDNLLTLAIKLRYWGLLYVYTLATMCCISISEIKA